ncbi:hypothetical protein Taro_035565 [Colocasia esculenta]|uniref:Uncharacterized protein n=1 Tax=Colocasia esculenta TaxID=4460 RepID=A0A843W711_COLES|nr:hypothetical protein [Colocasia esculenta]
MKGPAAAPPEQDKKLWRSTNTTSADHTAAGPSGRTTLHKSEGVQEDDTDLDGTQVPGQAPSTHVLGSHKTWGSQLKR